MELVVNGVIGILELVFGAARGVLGSNPILTGLGVGVGAYFGVRAAHRHASFKPPAPQASHR
jgi:hypothetical protein